MCISHKNDAYIIYSTDTGYIMHFWYFIYVLYKLNQYNATFTLTPIFFTRQEPQNNGCQSCSTGLFWRVAGWGGACFSLNLNQTQTSQFRFQFLGSHPLLHWSGLVSLLLMSAVPTAWLVDQFSCFVMQLVERHWYKLLVNHVQVGRVSSDSGSVSGTISIDRWGSVCMHLTSVLQLGESFCFFWMAISFI